MPDPVVHVETKKLKLAKKNMTIFYKWIRVKLPVGFFYGCNFSSTWLKGRLETVKSATLSFTGQTI